jgi:hypothetical protein
MRSIRGSLKAKYNPVKIGDAGARPALGAVK